MGLVKTRKFSMHRSIFRQHAAAVLAPKGCRLTSMNVGSKTLPLSYYICGIRQLPVAVKSNDWTIGYPINGKSLQSWFFWFKSTILRAILWLARTTSPNTIMQSPSRANFSLIQVSGLVKGHFTRWKRCTRLFRTKGFSWIFAEFFF